MQWINLTQLNIQWGGKEKNICVSPGKGIFHHFHTWMEMLSLTSNIYLQYLKYLLILELRVTEICWSQ